MIAGTVSEDTADRYRLLIRPNQSLSIPAMVALLVGFGVIMLSIGIYFVIQGMWPVLPIAGLEFAVLVLAFASVTRRAQDYDMVVIDDTHIHLHQCTRGDTQTHAFPRAWARVDLQAPRRHWHPSRLLVGSHGRYVEIGRCMTDRAREMLAAELKRSLTRVEKRADLAPSDPIPNPAGSPSGTAGTFGS